MSQVHAINTTEAVVKSAQRSLLHPLQEPASLWFFDGVPVPRFAPFHRRATLVRLPSRRLPGTCRVQKTTSSSRLITKTDHLAHMQLVTFCDLAFIKAVRGAPPAKSLWTDSSCQQLPGIGWSLKICGQATASAAPLRNTANIPLIESVNGQIGDPNEDPILNHARPLTAFTICCC